MFVLELLSILSFFYRTARGKNQGAALSFISIAEMQRFEIIKQQLADEYSEL